MCFMYFLTLFQQEMKVACILSDLDARGLAVAGGYLRARATQIQTRMQALASRASQLTGRPAFNMASAQQLADVLYVQWKEQVGWGSTIIQAVHAAHASGTCTLYSTSMYLQSVTPGCEANATCRGDTSCTVHMTPCSMQLCGTCTDS